MVLQKWNLVRCQSCIGRALIAGLLVFAVACGGDEEEAGTGNTDDPAPQTEGAIELDVGDSVNFAPVGGKITLDFSAASSSAEHVIQLFHTGNIATVDGAGSEKSAFTVAGAALTDPNPMPFYKALGRFSKKPSKRDVEDRLRFLRKAIWNRWIPSRGINGQAEGVWELVEAYDRLVKLHKVDVEPLEKRLRSNTVFRTFRSSNLTSTACPAVGASVALPSGSGSVTEVTDGGNFCLISTTATDDTHANLKTSMDAALAVYKVLYDTTFGDVKNGITFKPFIIFTDLHVHSGYENLVGVFVSGNSVSAGVPMIYMSAKLSNIGKTANDSGLNEVHATLAHELQHAIVYYFKGTSDALYIDEGLAHLMEDMFGFQEVGFATYANDFLGVKAFGVGPFLGAQGFSGGSSDAYLRGAGQSFLYYLFSRKGAASFSGGAVTGGGGVEFIRSMVKSSSIGLANVRQQYSTSTSWLSVVGNYLSALVVDNAGVDGVPGRTKLVDKDTDVTNLRGASGKTFGMRYNEGSLATYSALSQTSMELHHYETVPFKHTGTGQVVIDTVADGAAAAVVRIK